MKTTPIAAAALILATSAAHAGDPFKPSKAEQVKLGQQAAGQLRDKEHVLPDSDPRVQMLRRLGARMVKQLDLRKEPWKFTFDVIDSKEVNAFALPGGPVFFYTGILDRMKTEDEVAGVLGHEMTHVLREHWAYAVRDQQKRDIGLTVGALFGVQNGWLQAGSLLGSLTDLKFSRAHESQADESGFALMVKSGYNPQGMVDVFKMLQTLGSRGPEFLSDHPDPGNRVKKLQGFVDKNRGNYPALTPLPFDTPAKRGEFDKKKG